jgi:hypothetical protein
MSGYRRSVSGSRSFKGRKKVVKEFAIQQGLFALAIVALAMLLIAEVLRESALSDLR